MTAASTRPPISAATTPRRSAVSRCPWIARGTWRASTRRGPAGRARAATAARRSSVRQWRGMMDPQTPEPAGRRDHEGADRRRHGDRFGSDGRGGPRWTFRAPVAVRPGDIASAIADAVARAVGDQWRSGNAAPLRVLTFTRPLTEPELGHLRAIVRADATHPVPGPFVGDPRTAATYLPAAPHLSTSPDMAAPADVPSTSDVPTAEPAALRTPRAAHRRRSVSVAG